MVKVPTAFILGAGASNPYHFPMGLDLKNEICKMLDRPQPCLNPNNDPSVAEELRAFQEALQKSGQWSVDAFLERREEKINAIGKRAIAAALIPFEHENH